MRADPRAAIACVALALAGCTIAPTANVREACDLLDIAQQESELAEAWHLNAGKVLAACGVPNAIERAEHKACYARRFNNSREVCQ